MTQARLLHRMLLAAVLLVAPVLAEAGPPLICHPFETAGGDLLPWGDGPGWNTPDRRYDVQRLTADTLRVLSSDAPILTRMENMRRAVIYATRAPHVADQLLLAVRARAERAHGAAAAAALFDAGYLIETYKQAAHLHRRSLSTDGYALVLRAIAASGGSAEMEFAASLMTRGATSQSHLQRARAAAADRPLLARNIDTLWR